MISGTGALNRAAKLASDNWCWRLLVIVLTVQNDVRSMTTSDARYMTRNHASGGDSVRVARSQALHPERAGSPPYRRLALPACSRHHSFSLRGGRFFPGTSP